MKKIWLLIGLSVFLLTRLYNLLSLPSFLDETIYIRWLTVIKTTGDWLVPLKEFGWEPLNIWLAALVNRIAVDPLLALRLTAVFFGALSFLLTSSFQGRLTGLLIIFSPVILLHDRLGLRGDVAVVFLTVLCFYGLRQRLIKQEVKAVWLVAIALILGLLIKTTAAVLAVSVLLALLLFRPKLKPADWLAASSTFLPFVFYWAVGNLSAVFNKKEVFFGFTGLGQLKNNLLQILPWLWQYLTWPIVLLACLGIIWLYFKDRLIFKLWLCLFLPPLILLSVGAKIIFPRYLLPVYFLILMSAGYGWQWLVKALPKFLRPFSLVLLIPAVMLSRQIVTNMATAALPEIERWQYVTGWPSGYGLAELITYLKTEPPSILVTEDNDLIKSGLPYLWPDHPFVMTETATAGADFALNISERLPDGISGDLIKEFPRPENKSSIKLFKLKL